MALCLFVFAVACALPALSVMYLPLFVSDWYFVPLSVNRKPELLAGWNLLSSPLMNNIILFLMFTIPHSILPRSFIKEPMSAVISKPGYTCLYVVTSGVLVAAIMTLWSPLTHPIWSVPWKWAELSVTALFIMVIVMYRRTARQMDSLELLGLREPFNRLIRRPLPPIRLVTTGMYGRVRHPMMSLVILMMWITPHMTAGHLLFAVVLTIYIVTAVKLFEEPALIRLFGDPYRDYMKRVPCLIPRLFATRSEKATD